MKPILHLFQPLKSQRQPHDANWDGSQYTVCFNWPKPITMDSNPSSWQPAQPTRQRLACPQAFWECQNGAEDFVVAAHTATVARRGSRGPRGSRTTPGFMCVQSLQTTHTNPQRDDNRSYDESRRDCQG